MVNYLTHPKFKYADKDSFQEHIQRGAKFHYYDNVNNITNFMDILKELGSGAIIMGTPTRKVEYLAFNKYDVPEGKKFCRKQKKKFC